MEQVAKMAGDKSWEAVALVVTFGGILTFLTWLVRTWMKQSEDRELRMAKRIDLLEDFQRTILTDTLNKNSLAVQSLVDMLQRRPCLLPKEKP